ncbi:hypothetical protein BJ508DRAFT_418260 [Ascobolus immersus RN42]|uniref:FHA domain-containing protein n=1 Tax=Ascobolus immersus RN42 TaxID=1160509 RepID=A0A3N4HN14_ASCIM|nr:hypothetical protein BJ508DRAFT_418260 [Ascobolus immersus RN42]
MWILDCLDPAFGEKRKWLRPNTTYKLGRIPTPKEDEAGIRTHKDQGISRNHLDIIVGNADADTGSVLSRSELTLKDVGSKHGTTIDGELVKGESVKVQEKEVQFKLGSSTSVFRIRWIPLVLSFSLTRKEKKHGQLMPMRRAKVGPLDMKCIGSYVSETTHAIAKKRNTAVGLEALIHGRHIVTEEFLDALVTAATRPPKEKSIILSPLEDDYDAHMPDPMQYLPEAGNEPNPRSAESFAPKPERKTLFEGQTIVFCDKAQYESLLGPITAGGGKAEFFDKTGKSAREIVNFVEKAGGSLVRWAAEENEEMPLATKVSEMLGWRLPLQNEFLDMILTCDVSGLRKPLTEETEGPTSMFVKPQVPQKRKAGQVEVVASIPEVPEDRPSEGVLVEATMRDDSAPRPKRRAARLTTTQSTNFIDDFFTMPESEPSLPTTQRSSRRGNTQTQAASGIDVVFDSFAMTSSQAIPDSQASVRGRKRPTPDDDDEEVESNLAPGAERYKRLRLERKQAAEENGEIEDAEEDVKEEEEPEQQSLQTSEKETQRNADTTIDIQETVMQAAREVRIKEEEERNRDRLEREKLDPDAIAGMKNLAIVEIVDIPLREKKAVSRDQVASERWDPLWNGRANFKKFRRAVQRGGYTRRLGGRVMIEMVEERPKDFGVSQHYWNDDDSRDPQPPTSQRRTKASQRMTASELLKRDDTILLDSDSDEDDQDSFRLRRSPTKTGTPRGGRKSQTSSMRREETPVPDSSTRTSRLASPVPSSRTLRSRSTTPAVSVASSRTITNTVRAGTKRTASNANSQDTDFSANTPASGTASSNTRKKIKSFLQTNDSGDSDDDGEVKFRFNRRKR